MKAFEIQKVKAIAYLDNEVQDAILIHQAWEENKDGDLILFGYDLDELQTDYDVADAITGYTTSTDWYKNDKDVYVCLN